MGKRIVLSGNMREIPMNQENEILETRVDQYGDKFTLEYNGQTYFIYDEQKRVYWKGQNKSEALNIFWNEIE